MHYKFFVVLYEALFFEQLKPFNKQTLIDLSLRKCLVFMKAYSPDLLVELIKLIKVYLFYYMIVIHIFKSLRQ